MEEIKKETLDVEEKDNVSEVNTDEAASIEAKEEIPAQENSDVEENSNNEAKTEETKVEEASESKVESNKSENKKIIPEHGPIDEKNGKEIIVSLKNVDITFGKGDKAVKAVKNVSFDIYKGETFSLVGESGSGKTTIGRAVIRVNPLSAGEIDYKGVKISGKIPHALDREVIRNIQMVFQDPAASLNERATVEYIVSEGLYNFKLYDSEEDRIRKVENMIKEVGLLPEHLTRYPHEFSGGQRQRIGLARAFVMEPELIVADEPISALDVSIRAQVLNLLNRFKVERGLTCLFIAHDLSIVRFISDRIGVIYKGDIVEIAEAEELFEFPLHPYTRSLISAIPIPDPKIEKNKVLSTYDPSIHDYSEKKPSLVDIGNNHLVFGNEDEIAEYKRIRDGGEHPKSITILSDEEMQEYLSNPENNAAKVNSDKDEYQLPKPHDSGAMWMTVLSFFLPLFGLIAFLIFKHYNYIRNYKACKKGTIYGAILIGAIVGIFIIALIYAAIA